MDLSMLDVLIGLVSMYLLLSLVCSTLLEGINHLLNRRGAMMHEQLERLMGHNTMKEFCSLPGFGGLSTRGPVRIFAPDAGDPATIPDTMPAGTQAKRVALWRRVLDALRLSQPKHRFPSYIPTSTFAELALAWHDKFHRGREWCDDSEFGRMLIHLEGELGVDVAAKRQRVGEWFDKAMARTSGRFKARTQFGFALIAIALVVFANADSIRLADEIYRNPAIQAALVADAEATVANGITTQSADDLRTALQKFPLLGWPGEGAGTSRWYCQDTKGDAYRVCAQRRALVVLGWLITVMALMMGADFWFNALQKLIRIRTALKPGAELGSGASAPLAGAVPGATATATVAAQAVTPRPRTLVAPAPDLLARSRLLAQAAAFAYAGKDDALPTALTSAGYTSGAFFSDTTSGTQARILEHATHRVLSFRGTEPSEFADIQADLDRTLVAIPDAILASDPAKVHQGFAKALAAIWSELKAELDKGSPSGKSGKKPILITGHSLGGALAVLGGYALRLVPDGYDVIAIVTFGQPRVGDSTFAATCDRLFGPSLWRVVNHRDVVPRLAPRAMGFSHTGRVLYIERDGALTVNPSSWFRLLDRVPIDPQVDWNSQIREFATDHRMASYLGYLAPLE